MAHSLALRPSWRELQRVTSVDLAIPRPTVKLLHPECDWACVDGNHLRFFGTWCLQAWDTCSSPESVQFVGGALAEANVSRSVIEERDDYLRHISKQGVDLANAMDGAAFLDFGVAVDSEASLRLALLSSDMAESVFVASFISSSSGILPKWLRV
jgi:hypothetical protein